MWTVLKTFVTISLLSGKPHEVPASGVLLIAVALVELAASYVVAPHVQPGLRLAAVGTQSLFLALTVWAALSWRRHPERWLQTLTALYGSGIIVTLVAWLAFRGPAIAATPTATQLLLAAALTTWAIAIMSRVLRDALDITLANAVMITLAYHIVGGMLAISFPMD